MAISCIIWGVFLTALSNNSKGGSPWLPLEVLLVFGSCAGHYRLGKHHGAGDREIVTVREADICCEIVSSTHDRELQHGHLNKICTVTTPVDMPDCASFVQKQDPR